MFITPKPGIIVTRVQFLAEDLNQGMEKKVIREKETEYIMRELLKKKKKNTQKEKKRIARIYSKKKNSSFKEFLDF